MNKTYALIGPPAAGKTSIIEELTKYNVSKIISHTTRTPQLKEQNGVDYYFVPKETFLQTELVERIDYFGYHYGLSKSEVLDKINQFPVSVVAVEFEGFLQLRKLLGIRIESIYIMVDKNTIIERIITNGDDPEKIRHKIEHAEKAAKFDTWQSADHVIKNNGLLATAVRQILAIMDLVEPKSAKRV
jgi:guanylate kinase